MLGAPLVNTDESELALFRAERRVREIQAKLHRWAGHGPTAGLVERPLPGNGHGGVREAARGKPTGGNTGRAPRVDLTPLTAAKPEAAHTPVEVRAGSAPHRLLHAKRGR